MFRLLRPTFSQSRSGGNFFKSNHSAKRPRHEGSIPLGRPGRGEQEGGKGLRAFRPGEAPGPQGTPSTFKEASSTTAPQPQTRCAPGEAPHAEPARPSLAQPARDTGQTPGPPSGHPAPTIAGASPLRAHPARPPRAASPHPTLPAAARPGPRPPASRTPPSPAVPGAPRAPLLGRAAHRPSAPQPLPGPLAETPPPLAPPASRTAPRRRGPHRVSGAAGERTHAAARASHQRSAPPGAASFSPGLAGTSAHGSPHRGYF